MIAYSEQPEIFGSPDVMAMARLIARQQAEIESLRQDLADLTFSVADLLTANTILRNRARRAEQLFYRRSRGRR